MDRERISQTDSGIDANTGKSAYPPTKLLNDDSSIVSATVEKLLVILKLFKN